MQTEHENGEEGFDLGDFERGVSVTPQDQQDKSFLNLGSRTAAGKQRGSQQKTSDNPRHHPSEQFYKRGIKKNNCKHMNTNG